MLQPGERQRSFVVTTQVDRLKAFSLQLEHLSSYHSIGSSFDSRGLRQAPLSSGACSLLALNQELISRAGAGGIGSMRQGIWC